MRFRPRSSPRRTAAAKTRRRAAWRRVWRPARRLGFVVVAAAAPIGLVGWLLASGAPGKIAAEIGRAADGASVSLGLVVTQVSLTGRKEAAQADVVAAIGLARRQPTLLFDIAAARQRIESLGWVRSAHVGRRLPSTLEVVIEERLPFALWQRRGQVALSDRSGEVITSVGLGRFTSLPLVVGRDANEHAARLVDVMASVPDVDLVNLTGTIVNGGGGDTSVFEVQFTGDGLPHAFAGLRLRSWTSSGPSYPDPESSAMTSHRARWWTTRRARARSGGTTATRLRGVSSASRTSSAIACASSSGLALRMTCTPERRRFSLGSSAQTLLASGGRNSDPIA